MVLIGLLLLLAAIAVAVGVSLEGGETATVQGFGLSFDTTVAGVFFAGVVTLLLFMLGLWMMQGGIARSRRKRAERREARARHRESVNRLEEERTYLAEQNARLEQELARQRSAETAAAGTTATTGMQPAPGTSDRLTVREPGGGTHSEPLGTRGHDHPGGEDAGRDRPHADRPPADRPPADRPLTDRPSADRPGSTEAQHSGPLDLRGPDAPPLQPAASPAPADGGWRDEGGPRFRDDRR